MLFWQVATHAFLCGPDKQTASVTATRRKHRKCLWTGLFQLGGFSRTCSPGAMSLAADGLL